MTTSDLIEMLKIFPAGTPVQYRTGNQANPVHAWVRIGTGYVRLDEYSEHLEKYKSWGEPKYLYFEDHP